MSNKYIYVVVVHFIVFGWLQWSEMQLNCYISFSCRMEDKRTIRYQSKDCLSPSERKSKSCGAIHLETIPQAMHSDIYMAIVMESRIPFKCKFSLSFHEGEACPAW